MSRPTNAAWNVHRFAMLRIISSRSSITCLPDRVATSGLPKAGAGRNPAPAGGVL